VRDAERHLTYIRVRTDQGHYDIRDWQQESPLSMSHLVEKYLEKKQQESIGPKQLRHIEYVLTLAINKWGDPNIKMIAEGEVDDFLFDPDLKVGNKTRHNYKSALSDFWTWVVRREKRKSGINMIEFPDIKFELGWRKITDVATRQRIVEEVKCISYTKNPRIWLGIKLLTLYPKIRPGELINIQEGHINLEENWLVFPHPKEGKPKFVLLLPKHAAVIREHWEVRAMPHMYFFRHLNGGSGIEEDGQFGPKYLKKFWARACKNIGIEGITLYPGTKPRLELYLLRNKFNGVQPVMLQMRSKGTGYLVIMSLSLHHRLLMICKPVKLRVIHK
jgi:integrase